jgi:hypothetical protein
MKELFRKYRLLLFTILCFLIAEILRFNFAKLATLLSMLGWLSIISLWLGQVKLSKKLVFEAFLLTTTSLLVLLFFYFQSNLATTGLDSDNVYTFMSLNGFLHLKIPITFAGATSSYYQFPLMILTHLPEPFLFNFIGPSALHFGIILQFAFLISVFTLFAAPNTLHAKLVACGLFSACISNRFIVNSYDIVGYGVSSFCLGLIFLAVVLIEDIDSLLSCILFFISVALLHYYTSWLIILPILVLWTLTKKTSINRILKIASKDQILIGIVTILIMNLVIHPNLLLTRVQDVSIGGHGSNMMQSLLNKINLNSLYFFSNFPKDFINEFFISNPGKWHMLKGTAAVGWPLFIISSILFILSNGLYFFEKKKVLISSLIFFLPLIVLLIIQHLMTDFEDKRDLSIFYLYMLASLGFIFSINRRSRIINICLVTVAICFSIFNFYDLKKLNGKSHLYYGASPQSLKVLETLRLRKLTTFDLATYIVLPEFFPSKMLYDNFSNLSNLKYKVLSAANYCSNPQIAIENLLDSQSRPLQIIINSEQCDSVASKISYLNSLNGIFALQFSASTTNSNQHSMMVSRYLNLIDLGI